ncbi:MAG: hypothetical protein RLZZ148_43 [Cyanobacteriota bacterium]
MPRINQYIMDLKITKIQRASAQEWDQIWNNCDYATYFHSREWAEIWEKYSRGNLKPCPFIVRFSDFKKVLLPLSIRSLYKGFSPIYLSSPAGTFGGWLSHDELNREHAHLIYKFLMNLGDIQWRLNPYESLCHQIHFDNLKLKKDTTDVINLKEGFEAIHHRWTKGHSSAAKKARREGVNIRLATSAEDWQTYYYLYEASLERWGGKTSSGYKYEWSLFELMFDLQSSRIKLWLAEYKNFVIAGALCFYAKNHVVYWHGSALSEYFNLRPVNLLIFEIIKNACELQYEWFDFNPSGGKEGVKAFKRSFGTLELSCPMILKNSLTNSVLNKLKSLLSNT